MQVALLGWDECLLTKAAAWLWQRNEDFPKSLVVVPTAQAGWRLRREICEIAAQEGCVVFGLTIVTPAHFLEIDDAGMADDGIELLAWFDVLEGVDDWSRYAAAFPQAPEADGLMGLAKTMRDLRHSLQSSGLLIRDAARPLMHGGDTDRWQVLVALEDLVERKLQHWGYESRSLVMKELLLGRRVLPSLAEANRVFLVGIAEAVEVAWAQWERHGDVTHLLGAEEGDRACFDRRGVPNDTWLERVSPFPGRDGMRGSVIVSAGGRSLARQCVAHFAEQEVVANEVSLISCDAELDGEILRAFGHEGWVLHRPGQVIDAPHAGEWLRHWCAWLKTMDLGDLAGILPMPETACLTDICCKKLASSLAELRDQWLVRIPEDVERVGHLRVKGASASVEVLQKGLEDLLEWRRKFLDDEWEVLLDEIFSRWIEKNLLAADVATERMAMLQKWRPIRKLLAKPNHFWMELLCSDWPQPTAEAPTDRVMDVQGWLEAAFDKSPHLVLLGLSDGIVPSSPSNDTWLGESARKILKLATGESRAARDAYLYHALCANRAVHGRVDIFLSKTAGDGSVRRPSRILLQGKGRELAERVRHLFSHVEENALDLTWQQDWQWQINWDAMPGKAIEKGRSLSVTALRDYLACPFRFYLKHALHLQEREPDRGEWNRRDFGNIMHLVLENWGNHPEARDLHEERALREWLIAELDRIVARYYGENPAVAIRIQQTALAHRLQWFAQRQCEHYAQGWRIKEIEVPFSLVIGQWTIRGKVDRIDQNTASGRWHLWDYKSGNLRSGIVGEHGKLVRASTVIPAHLANDPRLFQPDGKTMWTNLQLPLYAASGLTSEHPEIGYISMGESEGKISFDPWSDYDESLTKSAQDCMAMILEAIDQKIFWPPAEKPKYDDFKGLTAGATLAEMIARPV